MLKIFIFLIPFLNFFLTSGQDNNHNSTELSFSINYSTIENDNAENRFGFGMAINKCFLLDENVKFISGIEYNRFIFYKKVLSLGQGSMFTKTTYKLSNISVPLLVRKFYNNFFIEPGAFFELNLGGRKRGNYFGTSSCHEDKSPRLYSFLFQTENFGVNYGPQLGMGFHFPFFKQKIILKCDYKYGITKSLFYSEEFTLRYLRLSAGLEIN